MKRVAWKWIYGISLALLVLLAMFTVGIWAVGNATAAMAGAIMGNIDQESFGYRYLPFGEFLLNAIGSPMFYVEVTVLAAHITAVVALAVTRKR